MHVTLTSRIVLSLGVNIKSLYMYDIYVSWERGGEKTFVWPFLNEALLCMVIPRKDYLPDVGQSAFRVIAATFP